MVEKHLPAKPTENEGVAKWAAVAEGPKKSAREVFQQRAMKSMQIKLSDCFSIMKDKEVNMEFMADGNNVKVFGFRGRKGIVIEGDACVYVTGFGGEEGGTAAIYLHRSLFFKLSKRGFLHKKNYWDRLGQIREEEMESLKGQKRFQSFLSVLDFLKSQKINAVVGMSTMSDDEYTHEIKDKYTLALRVKTLENTLKPKEAVQKVCDGCKDIHAILGQLDDHKMNEEAMILRKIIASKAGPKDLDGLMFTWSCRPPANESEIVIALGGSNLQEVKKFIENAIAEKEAEVKKRAVEAEKARKEVDSAVNAAWEAGLREEFGEKSWQLGEETKQLDNLRKAYEMLRSYKPPD